MADRITERHAQTGRMATLGVAALVTSATLVAGPAAAQDVSAKGTVADADGTTDAAAPDLTGDRITIGVGPAFIPRYEGARQIVTVPSIAIQAKLDGFAIQQQGSSIDLDLVRDDGSRGWKFQAGPLLNIRLDRTGRLGSGPVAALGSRKTAWEPGAWIGVERTGVVTSPYDTLSLSLSWQRDVSHAHDSSIISPSLSYDTPLSHHAYASVSLGADHVARRFGDYYYDIDAAGSAASGLPVYTGARRAGWKDYNTSLLLAHTLRGNLLSGLSLFGTAGYSRLLGAYARSPIVARVGNPNQVAGSFGLALSF